MKKKLSIAEKLFEAIIDFFYLFFLPALLDPSVDQGGYQ